MAETEDTKTDQPATQTGDQGGESADENHSAEGDSAKGDSDTAAAGESTGVSQE